MFKPCYSLRQDYYSIQQAHLSHCIICNLHVSSFILNLEACLKALERIPGTSTGSSLKSINGGLITKRVEQMENKSAAGLDRSHIEVD